MNSLEKAQMQLFGVQAEKGFLSSNEGLSPLTEIVLSKFDRVQEAIKEGRVPSITEVSKACVSPAELKSGKVSVEWLNAWVWRPGCSW